ncbi:hypothetical protein FSARC_3864 [Fusarium sarcochroum]|uniref:Uncharacterized protein n=1 Tax=Fusarium sarcochroum TaxID=1208366 RepID=A0A8H4U2T2_9HYPO|nr:hypothetical protein FSARC_3864 [Fusarium sarcochroum]
MSSPASPEQPAYMRPLPFRRAGYVYRLPFFSQRHRNHHPKSFDFSTISNYRNIVSPVSSISSSNSHMLMDFGSLPAQEQKQPDSALVTPQDQPESTLASSPEQSQSPSIHHEASATTTLTQPEFSPFLHTVYTSRSPIWHHLPFTGVWQSPGGHNYIVHFRHEDWEPDSGRLESGILSYPEDTVVESVHSELVGDRFVVIVVLAFLVACIWYVILVFMTLDRMIFQDLNGRAC